MTPPLVAALIKLAAKAPEPTKLAPKRSHEEKLDYHFGSDAPDKWEKFHKNLRSKGFTGAVGQDLRADDKLKRYAEAINMHHSGKGPKYKVRKYTVKFHEDKGRYSCSCNDWRYVGSHSGKDCKHIKEVQAMEKKAFWNLVNPTTVLGARKAYTGHDPVAESMSDLKARMVAEAYKRNTEMPKFASPTLMGLAAKRMLGG